jgi:integrase
LTKEEFRLLLARILQEPYRVMVLLAACVGLRTSEIFALLWSDFDWLRNEVFIQGSIAEGYEDESKIESFNAKLPLDPAIAVLQAWRQHTPFAADSDYVFASPVMLGKKPVEQQFCATGLSPPRLLDQMGTGIMVQKELMRHSTIAMTMDGYGRGVPESGGAFPVSECFVAVKSAIGLLTDCGGS